MMVYCRDRSMRLPRRKKNRVINNKTLRSSSDLPAPYRATDHRDKPSQLEQRCESGVWLTAKELEALQWLNSF